MLKKKRGTEGHIALKPYISRNEIVLVFSLQIVSIFLSFVCPLA